MRKCIAVLVVLLTVSLIGSAAQAKVREERRTLVGAELLGRGLFLTFNMERFLSPELGLGAGLLAAGSSDGGFAIVPLYASFVPGDVHSIYFSGGVTFAVGTDFGDADSTSALTLSVGYQYHSYGGLFIRPLLTLLIPNEESADSLFWPGVTIGGSF